MTNGPMTPSAPPNSVTAPFNSTNSTESPSFSPPPAAASPQSIPTNTMLPPEEEECQDSHEDDPLCDTFGLACVDWAKINCCRCKVECCAACGRSDGQKNPCTTSEEEGGPFHRNNNNNHYHEKEEEEDDGASWFLQIIFSATGASCCLIVILIGIRSRHRRTLAERRRHLWPQLASRHLMNLQPPAPPSTPEEEQARYANIVSAFHFRTVLKDNKSTSNSSTSEEIEECDEEEDVHVGDKNTKTTTETGLAEFFPWRKAGNACKDECCICLESYVQNESICVPISEGCNHVFHEECIVEWLKTTHNECPLCRVTLISDG